jgi:hypothetical protein
MVCHIRGAHPLATNNPLADQPVSLGQVYMKILIAIWEFSNKVEVQPVSSRSELGCLVKQHRRL